MSVSVDGHRIASQLENARKDLLDLTLRNPLLNYRTLKAKGAEILHSSTCDVFRNLVLEKRSYAFAPKVSATGIVDDKDSSDSVLGNSDMDTGSSGLVPHEVPSENTSSTHSNVQARRAVNSWATPYELAELDKRLLATYYAAHTYIEEQGVNVLYIAIGFLRWTETNSDTARLLKAPLILIPVSITRQSAQESFRAQYNDDEISENPSLYRRLESDFGIKLPPFPDNIEELDLTGYFSEISRLTAGQPSWSVDPDAIALGFFSFGKYMMYKDLDTSAWPEDKLPTDHVLMKQLLGEGFQEPPASIADGEPLDEHLLPTDIHNVLDADSSQILAIVDVKRGRNLVVQGPPGTGKSQTIANIIAELMNDGKRVLFVAEKMAALQVVRARLDRVGLGTACLELHSHKANKKSVLEDLRATWEQSAPEVAYATSDLSLLKDDRERLNKYPNALHELVGESGVTPFQALGHLVGLKGTFPEGTPRLRLDPNWTAEDFVKRRSSIADVQSVLQEAGCPVRHPFWGSRLTSLMPSDIDDVRDAFSRCRTDLAALMKDLTQLNTDWGMPPCAGPKHVQLILNEMQFLLDAPLPDDADLTASVWSTGSEALLVLANAMRGLADVRRRFCEDVRQEAWEKSVKADLDALRRHQHRLFRGLSGEYRRARKNAALLLKRPGKARVQDVISCLEAIEEVQGYEAVCHEDSDVARAVFRNHWQGNSSDWAVLATWAEWGIRIVAETAFGTRPTWLTAMVTHSDFASWRKTGAELSRRLYEWQESSQELVERLAWSEEIRPKDCKRLSDLTFEEWDDWLGQRIGCVATLANLVRVNQITERLRAQGLEQWAGTVEQWDGARQHIGNLFSHAWYQSILERAYTGRPELRDFVGTEHNQVVSRFQQFDLRQLTINQKTIAMSHLKNLPERHAAGQVGVLRHEFQKMKRHMPIRKLLVEAGRAVQCIKPVFMMSPMSVATYLAPNSVEFDVVIFDEASQVRPVDAYGAILRGKQIVVVGDRQQLPPSSFFDQLSVEEDAEEEHVAADVESILTLLSDRGVPDRMLRWHYRSRHESLIAVSNSEFYGNELVVFPSPISSGKDIGLVYRHLSETVYDRGGSRANRKEATAVAKTVMQHAERNPNLSLGVVAFSTAQMDAIQAEIEMLRRVNPQTESFFAANRTDPFFVKNLENVQGDERDVIFISVGYGKDANGYVTMNFGPLNNKGGERRLNVMISRARLRCEVFTNLLPDDIDLGKTSARGVQAFKTFLQYAKTGRMDVPVPTGRDADSPFEESVRDALVREGYRVEPQVGAGGFRIDMAVVDPELSGHYLLGIECDGATYHRARSARDRDRLRQQILEALGWKLVRIWSTDWFRDPDKELRRVLEAIELQRASSKAVTGLDEPREMEPALGDPHVTTNPGTEPKNDGDSVWSCDENPSSPIPYETAQLTINLLGMALHEVPRAQLAAWIVEVVCVESPVHVDEVYHRVSNAAGIKRVGARIRNAMDLALRVATKQGVVRRGEFLWNTEMKVPSIRDRSGRPEVSRKLEHIPPEEIKAAVFEVLTRTAGLEPDLVPGAVARCFGIQRLTEESRVFIDRQLQDMSSQRLITVSGRYVISTTSEVERVDRLLKSQGGM